MDLLNSNAKNKALKELEKAQLEYKLIGERANKVVVSLYNKRKEALHCIEEAELFLKKQPDFGIDDIAKIAEYRASIRLFVEAVQNEENGSQRIDQSTGQFIGGAAAGAAAGAAFAAFGPTAAMAFATTFGTAATGTAISALSGAAATNAALAWLGGGALAAGGGGIAAGSAILSLAGPIGLAIGTVSAGFAGFKLAAKNKEITDKAKLMSSEINRAKNKLECVIGKVERISSKISNYIAILKDRLHGTSIDGKLIFDYSAIVSTIYELCSLIKSQISV